jgi:hypothetical protein
MWSKSPRNVCAAHYDYLALKARQGIDGALSRHMSNLSAFRSRGMTQRVEMGVDGRSF